MANNSMYLRHNETGEKIRIAKYYPSSGWGWIATPHELQEWLNRFSEDDQDRNGVSYRLEYEHGPDDFLPNAAPATSAQQKTPAQGRGEDD